MRNILVFRAFLTFIHVDGTGSLPLTIFLQKHAVFPKIGLHHSNFVSPLDKILEDFPQIRGLGCLPQFWKKGPGITQGLNVAWLNKDWFYLKLLVFINWKGYLSLKKKVFLHDDILRHENDWLTFIKCLIHILLNFNRLSSINKISNFFIPMNNIGLMASVQLISLSIWQSYYTYIISRLYLSGPKRSDQTDKYKAFNWM